MYLEKESENQMKFLLVAINAKYIHSNPAIYSLRAYAGPGLQEHIQLAEYTINNRMEDILGDIYRQKPDVIGFSCYIWNWSLVQELLTELPKILPGTQIWLGGPEVSYDAPEILEKYPQVSGIMIGEGEATFKELVEVYVKAEEEPVRTGKQWVDRLRTIDGLCLPTGYTPMRESLDMNDLPFLYSEMLHGELEDSESTNPKQGHPEQDDLGKTNSEQVNSEETNSPEKALENFENRIIYYESSRGCPYRCSYCLSSIDKKVRLRDTEKVKEELQFFLDHRVKQVKFVDRTFNADRQHARAIWRYIAENDNGVTNFHFEISADILKEEDLELLATLRPGLIQLEIGVQSANGETLESVHRFSDLKRLEENVDRVRRNHNIHQHLDLIAGLPYEDYESFGKSFDRVYAMKPEQLQLGFLKVLKGSEMQERASEYGIQYLDRPPYEVLSTKWLSYGEVLRLKQIEEMVELYYNSNQFTHTLPYLERCFAGPFAMYEALADFYEAKGYFVNSPARAYRYEVLFRFACEADPAGEAVYRELLTFDMYLRENLKSRPAFIGDISGEDKAVIRDIYREEEEKRVLLPGYEGYDWKQLSKMTHMEAFRYPVWDEVTMDTLRGKTTGTEKWGVICARGAGDAFAAVDTAHRYVLFDYANRNPLTYEARVVVL